MLFILGLFILLLTLLTYALFCDIISLIVAALCNGSTADSDSVCLGSNPSAAAIFVVKKANKVFKLNITDNKKLPLLKCITFVKE